MSHNSSSRVQVTNNFPYPVDVTIDHTYDTSPSETHTWWNVMKTTTTGPDLTATYPLGPSHWGHDRWQATVQLLGGPKQGKYISDVAACTLHHPDNGAILTFAVGPLGFTASAARNHDTVSWTTHP